MSTVEQVSAEAIQYQRQTPLFDALTDAFQKKLDGIKSIEDVTAGSISMSDMEEIIKEHTGLPFTVSITRQDGHGMHVYWPAITMHHPFYVALQGVLKGNPATFGVQQAALKKAKLVAGEFHGMIDLEKSQVTGALQNFACELLIPFKMFDNYMNARELAAIALHEIGHAFTYLEKLLSTTSTNLTVLSAWYDYASAQDSKQKIKLVDSLYAELKVKNAKTEDLVEMKTKEEFVTVILNGYFDHIRSSMGSTSYDARMTEVAADQFAYRHGAGKDLVIALDKINRRYGNIDYLVESAYSLSTAIMLSLTTLLLMLIPWAGWLLLTTLFVIYLSAPNNYDQKTYDDPGERMDRAIYDLTQVSKRMKQDSQQASQIADDIKAIYLMRRTVRDNKSLFFFIWRNMKSQRRDQYKQKMFQSQLEELINNRLYVHSILLNTLAKK